VENCYEAGRDEFWLHRYLEALGMKNLAVDSASIGVSRRFRRAKTDRIGVGKLLGMLMRYHLGEKKVWSVVHVPSPGAGGDDGGGRSSWMGLGRFGYGAVHLFHMFVVIETACPRPSSECAYQPFGYQRWLPMGVDDKYGSS
jgi:hypothetical protein